MNIILIISAITLFILVRLPHIARQQHGGCDAYYFLLCREYFRQSWSLPIVLPKLYLLEYRHQYYPPLFAMLLALLPLNWLERHHHRVNHMVECCFITLATLLVASHLGSPPWLTLACIVLYSLSIPVIHEFASLTSRPMALGLHMLLIFFLTVTTPETMLSPSYVIALALGVILIFLHKLTLQLIIATLVVMTLVTGQLIFIFYLPLIYLLAYLIHPQQLKSIVKGHVDIVKFWAQHHQHLGTHSIYASNYYNRDHPTRGYYAENSWQEICACLHACLRYNFLAYYPVIDISLGHSISTIQNYLLIVIGSTYFLSVLTWLMPAFRCFGLGQQYIKYSLFPCLAYIMADTYQGQLDMPHVFMVLGTLTALQYFVSTFKSTSQAAPRQARLLTFLERHPEINANTIQTLFCCPYHIADLVVYHRRIPTLWGTHGFGFERIAPIFPVLTMSLDDVAAEYGASHVLFEKDYCQERPAGWHVIAEDESYILFSVRQGTSATSDLNHGKWSISCNDIDA